MIANSGQKQIFVVEDDPSVRTMLVRALSTTYKVEEFGDGNAVLRRLQKQPYPNLILCDIMMPGLDGLSLVQKMKERPDLRAIPVMFLTAKTAPQDVIKGIQAGARGYITKPFKIAELLQKLDKALKRT